MMRDPGPLIWLLMVTTLIIVGIERARGSNVGCFSYFPELAYAHADHSNIVGGVRNLYICDDTAVEIGLEGTDERPNLFTNQVVWETRCGGMRAKVWIVNCNRT